MITLVKVTDRHFFLCLSFFTEFSQRKNLENVSNWNFNRNKRSIISRFSRQKWVALRARHACTSNPPGKMVQSRPILFFIDTTCVRYLTFFRDTNIDIATSTGEAHTVTYTIPMITVSTTAHTPTSTSKIITGTEITLNRNWKWFPRTRNRI